MLFLLKRLYCPKNCDNKNNLNEENVILVNERDEQIGIMPKMEAHEKALLHRAFSVFVMNNKKYHSPLLWTNTCCSHQRVGETNIEAGKRRLEEEMGFVTELKELCSFIYKAPFDNGLTEHEFDHVMIGDYNEDPIIYPEEVADWRWMKPEDIQEDIAANPDEYTAWFKIIFERFYEHLTQNIS